jgi:hypothetical protein
VSGPVVTLDFAAPRLRMPLAGLVLLLLGASCLGVAAVAYRNAAMKRAGLELKLASLVKKDNPKPLKAADAALADAQAARITRELAAPWTAMLADLESASQDTQGQVAVLSVEPDHQKHRIRISGESKDLTLALAYLERLKKSNSLRYPMLDSHEIVADDAEHPVRFAMTADWQEQP